MSGLLIIWEERERQKCLGYTPERDDSYGAEYYEDLICAAGTYEMEPTLRGHLETWPWDVELFRSTYQAGYAGRIRELAKAGALYQAAKEHIERNGLSAKLERMMKGLDDRIARIAKQIDELLFLIQNPY